MANDRMYLKCTHCGEALLLMKNFGGHWKLWECAGSPPNPQCDVPSITRTLPKSGIGVRQRVFNTGERINTWMHAHTFGHDCPPEWNSDGSWTHFTLRFESEDHLPEEAPG